MDGDPPEGLPAKEIIVLHDPDAEKSVVIVFFDSEDDYRQGHEVLERDARRRHTRPAHLSPEVRGADPKDNLSEATSRAVHSRMPIYLPRAARAHAMTERRQGPPPREDPRRLEPGRRPEAARRYASPMAIVMGRGRQPLQNSEALKIQARSLASNRRRPHFVVDRVSARCPIWRVADGPAAKFEHSASVLDAAPYRLRADSILVVRAPLTPHERARDVRS